MHDLAVEEIGDRGEPDMGMGPDIEPAPHQELGRPHLVEKDKRADHLAAGRGQGAPDLEPAEIAGPGQDRRLDPSRWGLVRSLGLHR